MRDVYWRKKNYYDHQEIIYLIKQGDLLKAYYKMQEMDETVLDIPLKIRDKLNEAYLKHQEEENTSIEKLWADYES